MAKFIRSIRSYTLSVVGLLIIYFVMANSFSSIFSGLSFFQPYLTIGEPVDILENVELVNDTATRPMLVPVEVEVVAPTFPVEHPSEDVIAAIKPIATIATTTTISSTVSGSEKDKFVSTIDAETPQAPLWIAIEAIGLDTNIIPMEMQKFKLAGKELFQWAVPEEAVVGWHESSAQLGEEGNIVLNGHHNAFGEVFRELHNVKPGDEITIQSTDYTQIYVVANVMILPEKYENLYTRMENARWIMPSEDTRLTLITCHPYETNTHRLIVVASPKN